MAVHYDVIVKGNTVKLRDGYLGLANVTLVDSPEGPLLFDTGHYANRQALLDGLAMHGLEPSGVKVVFLSHLHFDHCLNIDLFSGARVLAGSADLEYVESPDPEDIFVPWLIREQLAKHDFETVEGEGEICPGIRYIPTPGHTPGSFSVILEADEGSVVLTGDAVHHAKELMTGVSEMYFGSAEDSSASIKRIASLADRIVPGHFPELKKSGPDFIWDEDIELDIVIR